MFLENPYFQQWLSRSVNSGMNSVFGGKWSLTYSEFCLKNEQKTCQHPVANLPTPIASMDAERVLANLLGRLKKQHLQLPK